MIYSYIYRNYYREGETKEFENLECEWPIFYVLMIIDGVFKNLPDQVEEYQNLLKARIKTDKYGGKYYAFTYEIFITSSNIKWRNVKFILLSLLQ